ncbi:ATP-dependent nuclease [Undibacterium sp. TJN25]|uniref:ATP-dependent nuclease n=1 Tax=Undibacterium sp. TJN25 TaxID=3413056 RepID=UPI003BF2D77F
MPRLPALILAVEEPELYLHPARSRYMAKILRDLSLVNDPVAGAGTQILSVTHSPYFVNVKYFDEVRMCRKRPVLEEGRPHETIFESFTRLAAARRLAEIYENDPESYTANSFVARATPVLNSIVNEGLFAEIVVVVEGDSDVAAIWAMQEIMQMQWDENGIVVLPVGGKNNIDRAVVAFQGVGIPTYFVFDGDISTRQGVNTNRALLRLANVEPADFPATGVYGGCAVFEDKIETYLRTAVGGRYDQILQGCATQAGYIGRESLKNSEVMALFVKTTSQENIDLPLLREIVNMISIVGAQFVVNPNEGVIANE